MSSVLVWLVLTQIEWLKFDLNYSHIFINGLKIKIKTKPACSLFKLCTLGLWQFILLPDRFSSFNLWTATFRSCHLLSCCLDCMLRVIVKLIHEPSPSTGYRHSSSCSLQGPFCFLFHSTFHQLLVPATWKPPHNMMLCPPSVTMT